MNLPRPHAVLFDWDNTLIDSWPVIHAALNATLSSWNLPLWSIDEVRQKVKYSMRDSFPGLFGDDWPKAGDHYLKEYRSRHLENLTPLELAEEVLKGLTEQGIFLGIVSNKTGDTLRKEVAHLGWEPYFKALVGAGDAEADKPSPAPVIHALKGTGIDPKTHTVWLVGDAITDVECARNTGCIPVFYGNPLLHAGDEFTLLDGEGHVLDHTALIELVKRAFG